MRLRCLSKGALLIVYPIVPHNSSVQSATYGLIIRRAWPIILANSATPLLGLADTAVIGRTASIASLGAIALGSLIFSFVYWTFGFLRMGTTGMIAQAVGSGDEVEARAITGRSLLIAIAIGVALILLQVPLFHFALRLLSGSPEVETLTEDYLSIRIWAAPATLSTYTLMGVLIGLGHSRALLATQIFLNALNIALDVILAGYLGMGVTGIGLGTMIAEWATALLALFLTLRILGQRSQDSDPLWSWPMILNTEKIIQMIGVNTNIMIRTFCLLLGFGWFTQQGARLGEITLAANHILLQFINFSSFFLDGIAYTTEALVGAAKGAKNVNVFATIIRKTSILAAATAFLFSLGILWFGPLATNALTNLEPARQAAIATLPFAALYILFSFAAFQLDAIYIGSTRTRDMRNTALITLAIFIAIGWPLTSALANTGLWIAFIVFIIVRATTLGVLYPRLKRSIAGEVAEAKRF